MRAMWRGIPSMATWSWVNKNDTTDPNGKSKRKQRIFGGVEVDGSVC